MEQQALYQPRRKVIHKMKKFFIYIGICFFFVIYAALWSTFIGGNEETIYVGSLACFCVYDYVDRNF